MSPPALATRVVGSGAPVTVVAHGLGGGIAETRPLAGGVPGTRVLYEARGHGASPLGAEEITWRLLADDLDRVASRHAATCALGVSMGAGTLLSLLGTHGDRFARVLLLLPPGPVRDVTPRLGRLVEALEGGNAAAVRASVRDDLPVAVRERAEPYVSARTQHLLASSGVAQVARSLADLVPDLSGVRARVLVVAQPDDPLHPVEGARHWAEAIPGAALEVLGAGAVFTEPARLRSLVREFFSAP